MEQIQYLIPLFFIIALIYSSVGFGGGSSYLAIMAMFAFPYILMPKVALACNIIVVSGSCLIYLKTKHLKIKKALPFVLGSIPMAYLGGKIYINKEVFLFILSISLITASFNMLLFNKDRKNRLEKNKVHNLNNIAGNDFVKRENSYKNIPGYIEFGIGCFIGLLSGMVGIGGGIFLAPILYLSRWGKSYQIAATSSFFILANSISGLFGQVSKGAFDKNIIYIFPLIITVFIGGQIGSRLSTGLLPELLIKKTTAVVVMFVGVRILYKLYLFP